MTIGERIKARRTELGMTLQNLADKVGYESRATIQKLESGSRKINPEKVKDFAVALETTPQHLMGWDSPARYNTMVGESINAIRENQGLSSAELADRYNSAFPPEVFEDPKRAEDIDALEHGLIPADIETVFKFAAILDVTPEDINSSWSSAYIETEERRLRIKQNYKKMNEDQQIRLLEKSEEILNEN